MCGKFGEIWTRERTDKQTEKRTEKQIKRQTDRHTDTLIAIILRNKFYLHSLIYERGRKTDLNSYPLNGRLKDEEKD